MVNTTTALRRAVSLQSLDALDAEISTIERAANIRDGGEGARVSGNWSIGQIFQHLARTIECFYAGAESGASFPARTLSLATRKMTLARPMATGAPMLPECEEVITPDAVVWTDVGAAVLRAQLARLAAREINPHAHPRLGSLAHEDWVRLHLRHAELHLSFVHLGGVNPAPWRMGPAA